MSAEAIEYYTYEDYRHWEGDWELIDGIAYAMSPAPMINHQNVATEILYHLRGQLDTCLQCKVLGEVDYKISDDTILRPDIVLTCDERGDRYLTKAPEIVIEILSPSTASRDEKYKFALYEQEKVRYYILVYPEDLRAKIYRLKDSRYDKVGDFLTEHYHFDKTSCGIELNFEKVFRRLR